ncbi:MAG: GTP-binding protein [Nanoarchaeota archaeon]|nr:GTP-binding protein [Nanoarchaeota archaeon]
MLIAKIVLLGSGAVGKTSLVRRFVHSTFSEDYISTIGSVTYKKEVSTNKGDIRLMIWDLHGQKLSSKLHSANYMGAKGALIVYDSTRKSTFDELTNWVNDLYAVVGNVPIVIVGNKYDLLKDFQEDTGIDFKDIKHDEELKEKFDSWMREKNSKMVEFFKKNYPSDFESLVFEPVSYWQLTKFAKRNFGEVPYFVSSAKTGENVENAFKSLAELILGDVNGTNDSST